MTERKRWPDHVEDKRLDAIALLHDMEAIQLELEEANRRSDRVAVANFNIEIAKKREKAKRLLREARTL